MTAPRVLYQVLEAPFLHYIWRADPEGRRAPERVELAGPQARHPAVAPSRDRLAFARGLGDVDIYRFGAGPHTEVVLASTFFESAVDFSPDGRRLAFGSARLGERMEVWVATADGSLVDQLTHRPGLWQDSPRWSPDGSRIAFDSRGPDGHWDVWTIAAEGGPPRRLTQNPGDDNVPSWSRDGRWVYYSSERNGSRRIWRIPAEGGEEEPVTGGGTAALESRDGKTLLFRKEATLRSPLLALNLEDGTERTAVECVYGLAWGFGIAKDGVYYAGCEPGSSALHRLDLASGRDEILGRLDQYWPTGFAVSPDGQSVLYGKRVGEGSNIMLIDNFR